MPKRATEDILDGLHGLLAESLKEQLENYKNSDEPIPPQLLAQCIKFLKDNGIDAPGREHTRVSTLADELDDINFDDEDDTVVEMKR